MNQSQFWLETLAYAKRFRHLLHRQPELSWAEVETAKLIQAELTDLGIAWRGCAKYGTVACLNAQGSGSHIALRADIDALPIAEQTDVAWRSNYQGIMHACGHDGHAAVLLGTARWLKLHETQLTGPVSLIFQPAEEGGHGAKQMIEDGALIGVDQLYGWHNWPALPLAKMLCPDSTIMSGNGTFVIELHGKGGHASQPELCRDPVLAAAALTVNLQQIVARRIAPQSAAVVSVTSIEALSGLTVIPDKAKVSGSIRFSEPSDQGLIEQYLLEISEQTAASYGVACSVEIQPRYAPTVNHAAPAEQARASWKALYGESALLNQGLAPLMASEDFSYYLNEIAGAYAIIGAGESAESPPCHSPHYDFNDQLIETVIRWYSQLVGVSSPPPR